MLLVALTMSRRRRLGMAGPSADWLQGLVVAVSCGPSGGSSGRVAGAFADAGSSSGAVRSVGGSQVQSLGQAPHLVRVIRLGPWRLAQAMHATGLSARPLPVAR